jgi:uncharacterized protein
VIAGKEEEAQKYKDYFDWQEPVAHCPSHRLLAMRRAEKEGLLTLNIRPNEETALAILEKQFLRSGNQSGEQVKLAIKESYKRLLSFSLETELRIAGKDEADKEAVRVFAENLRQLLLAAPFGKNVCWQWIQVFVLVANWFAWMNRENYYTTQPSIL